MNDAITRLNRQAEPPFWRHLLYGVAVPVGVAAGIIGAFCWVVTR